MNRTSQKILVWIAAIAGFIAIIHFAQTRPGYFGDPAYIAEVLLLQVIAVSVWHYEKVFFALLMFTFVWAGTGLPFGNAGTSARWLVLTVAALAGFIRWMKCRHQHFEVFDLVALICAATALVSAVVSALPEMAVLKAFSLFLLFLYGSAGARLAVLGRERNFINGLVGCCEMSVYLTLVLYFVFHNEFFGNTNSLGAVMGVVVSPVLVWASLVAGPGLLRRRRILALILCWFLLYFSLSRAGIVAAALSSVILCTVSRRRTLLVRVGFPLLLLFAAAQVVMPKSSEAFATTFRSSVLYKGKEREELFGSRRTPWQKTMSVIDQHPWFGSGFGTSDIGTEGRSVSVSSVETNEETGREHGSSYLALVEWVGLLGVVPFALLFGLLLQRIALTLAWTCKSPNLNHCSIPLALVLVSGLVHGLFEDWIVAPGYYLTILFWSLAFIFMCIAPRRSAKSVRVARLWREGFAASPGEVFLRP
jgi:O-antigen ligase